MQNDLWFVILKKGYILQILLRREKTLSVWIGYSWTSNRVQLNLKLRGANMKLGVVRTLRPRDSCLYPSSVSGRDLDVHCSSAHVLPLLVRQDVCVHWMKTVVWSKLNNSGCRTLMFAVRRGRSYISTEPERWLWWWRCSKPCSSGSLPSHSPVCDHTNMGNWRLFMTLLSYSLCYLEFYG